MKDRVSFEGIGEVMATFYAGEGVKGGQVVKLGGDGEVIPCGAGERFCGLAVSGSAGYAGVQVAGFAQVKCGDGAVAAGYVTLTADGSGGVKKAGAGDQGQEYLVVSVDDGYATVRI